jgi:hypothetical protein
VLLLAAGAYGGYFFAVSRLARLEDAAEVVRVGASPRVHLRGAAALLVGISLVGLAGAAPSTGTTLLAPVALVGVPPLLALLGARGLLARAAQPGPWTAAAVESAVGLALRRSLLATATLAWQGGTAASFLVAGAILCGYPLSHALRRALPPT